MRQVALTDPSEARLRSESIPWDKTIVAVSAARITHPETEPIAVKSSLTGGEDPRQDARGLRRQEALPIYVARAQGPSTEPGV